ncbi:GNAT family N-acetyltransferase [Chitinophaga pollutisoli]|uniref:GNAT family N-acetyltransferase n=1 Tax=Chitinophaga pollutisoli TaxID=3133966 RepID=A0ABZ2YND9_9BACT
MTDTYIRRATETDLPALTALEYQTFSDAFRIQYPPEDFEAFLRDHKSPEAVRKAFRQEGSEYYVAAAGEQLTGFVQLNFNKQPDNGTLLPEPVMEIEKIYVLQTTQSRGTGKALIHYALQLARQRHVRTVWLGVWKHNPRARALYEREGFSVFGEHAFIIGSRRDRDLLMAKVLTGNS